MDARFHSYSVQLGESLGASGGIDMSKMQTAGMRWRYVALLIAFPANHEGQKQLSSAEVEIRAEIWNKPKQFKWERPN